MILFQWLAFGILGCLLIMEISRNLRGSHRGLTGIIRSCLWIAAIVCIAWPNLTTRIAEVLGITRGADLVLYVFVLSFLATSLYFYSRQMRLESQLTQLVRHHAIQDAHHGESTPLSEPN